MADIKAVVILKGGPKSGHRGHRGRPGKRGGSLPGVGGRVGMSAPADYVTSPAQAIGPGEALIGAGVDSMVPERFSHLVSTDPRKKWQLLQRELRGEVKAKVVEELAEESGAHSRVINDKLATWATTSNDNDSAALSMQEAAAEEFGVKLSNWQQSRTAAGAPVDPTWRNEERAILRAMYKNTQTRLREAGIGPNDTVTLYRGARIRSGTPQYETVKSYKVGDSIGYEGNAIESWSVSFTEARHFGRSSSGILGLTIAVRIPAKNIISTAVTGFGCVTEGEFVVLGSIPNSEARVVNVATWLTR